MLDMAGSRAATGALVYRRALGRWRQAGHVTSACWPRTAKRNIAFAEIDAAATTCARLAAEIYLDKEGKWERRMVRAVHTDRAVFRPARARATPPGRF